MKHLKIEPNGKPLMIGALVAGALGIAGFYTVFPHAPWFGAACYAFVAGLAVDSIIWLTVFSVILRRRAGGAIGRTDTKEEIEQ